MLQIKATLFSWYTARAVIILTLLLITGILYGCGGGAVKKEFITFQIMPDTSINDERPVYIVIRKVNKMEFLIENYDGIAGTVFANPPDESVLAWHMLLPGQNEKIAVVMPEKADIGVYVLFASPGDNWKMILEKPLKSEYKINVKNNELEEYRKGLLW